MNRLWAIYLTGLLLATTVAQAQRVTVWLAMPRTLAAENAFAGVPPNQDSLFRNNDVLWGLVATWLSDALQGEIPLQGLSAKGKPRRIPPAELIATLCADARLASTNLAAIAQTKTARTEMLLPGIDGVEVGGRLFSIKIRGNKLVRFRPTHIRIVWRNPAQTPPTHSLGTLHLESKMLQAPVGGQTLGAFLAGCRYYGYPIQIGDYYPAKLPIALYLRTQLLSNPQLLYTTPRLEMIEKAIKMPTELMLSTLRRTAW